MLGVADASLPSSAPTLLPTVLFIGRHLTIFIDHAALCLTH